MIFLIGVRHVSDTSQRIGGNQEKTGDGGHILWRGGWRGDIVTVCID